ncbi:MAG: LysM peptidoglycan-binding domain-containing protein, partial [Methylophilaceae bacterium]
MRLLFLGFISFFLVACASNPPAPVIERAPQASKPSAVPSNSGPTKPSVTQPAEVKPALGKDWRPDSYTVKKGDTLFSIGLEFGYDYKEIAAANNIVAPYLISIGQKLSFTSLNSSLTAKNGAAENKPITEENEDGVIISPIKTNPTIASTSTEIKSAESPVASAVTPELTEPKA